MTDATKQRVISLDSRRPKTYYTVSLVCDPEGVVEVHISGQDGYSPDNVKAMAAILRDAAHIMEVGDEV